MKFLTNRWLAGVIYSVYNGLGITEKIDTKWEGSVEYAKNDFKNG